MFRLILPLLLTSTTAVMASDAPPQGVDNTDSTAIPTEEIQRYVGVYRAIKQAYVEPLSDQALMRAALRGLLTDLDPHSAYLQKAEADALREQASGRYAGIGVEIEQRPDRSLMVVAPLDDSPAARAGLRSGDVIVGIDGKPIEAEHAEAASRQLRGTVGSVVTLSVLSPGDKSPRDVRIVRELIRSISVSSQLLAPGYGYLRISTFQTDTGPELSKQLAALFTQSDNSLVGVVLDLRSNPGGLLSAAVEAADVFLEQGLIVSTRGRLNFASAEYRAKPGDASAGAALVVLVDSGTASAAEVLAGALSDHRRGQIMGSRTFGKGSVQTLVPLDNGDSLKLTTARYYTPNGHSIQASGITPDIVLRGKASRGLREQDLPRHLGSSNEINDGFARGEVIEGQAAIDQALAWLQANTSPRDRP